jgi:predicted nucleotidyltransferase
LSKQERALEHIVARCVDAHPDCGIRLQGSVARGDERESSDIDLTVVIPRSALVRENELLSADNHWRMRLVHDEATGVKLDINWVGAEELLELVAERGAIAWYMFKNGKTLRDPAGLVARCATAISAWFEARPAVLEAWDRQQTAVEAFKRDPSRPLEFPTQPAFLRHLVANPPFGAAR